MSTAIEIPNSSEPPTPRIIRRFKKRYPIIFSVACVIGMILSVAIIKTINFFLSI